MRRGLARRRRRRATVVGRANAAAPWAGDEALARRGSPKTVRSGPPARVRPTGSPRDVFSNADSLVPFVHAIATRSRGVALAQRFREAPRVARTLGATFWRRFARGTASARDRSPRRTGRTRPRPRRSVPRAVRGLFAMPEQRRRAKFLYDPRRRAARVRPEAAAELCSARARSTHAGRRIVPCRRTRHSASDAGTRLGSRDIKTVSAFDMSVCATGLSRLPP